LGRRTKPEEKQALPSPVVQVEGRLTSGSRSDPSKTSAVVLGGFQYVPPNERVPAGSPHRLPVARLHYHFVFTTKLRKPALKGEVGLRVHDLIREICRPHDIVIVKGHVRPDHVHPMLSQHRACRAASFVLAGGARRRTGYGPASRSSDSGFGARDNGFGSVFTSPSPFGNV
jgi:hypothetical protein